MHLRIGLAASLLLATPWSAGARDVGVGVGLELPAVTLAEHADVNHDQRLVVLELPVFAGALRFTPAVGYASGHESFGPSLAMPETTRLSLGGSVAWVLAPAERLRSWVGPRGGVVLRSVEDDGDTLDPFVGGVLGGEYFLGPSVSLGADLRCTYASLERGRYVMRRTYVIGPPGLPGDGGLEFDRPRGWSLVADAALSLRFYPW